MRTAILHIGTHKTGTTWIQEVMSANRGRLKDAGLNYPDIGHGTGHHAFIAEWVNLPALYHLSGGQMAAWTQLNEEISGTGESLLLSSEEFSRQNERVDFDAVKQQLSQFDDIKVVCLLRDQVSFIQSIYLEISKHISPPGWVAFLQEALKTNTAAGLFLDYNDLYDFLLSSFRPDQIIMASYTDILNRKGGVVQFLLDQFDIGLSFDDLTQPQGGRNPSPNPLAAWTANTVARPETAPDWLIKMTGKLLEEKLESGRETTIYTQQEIESTAAHFAHGNARLAQRLATVGQNLDLATTNTPYLGYVGRDGLPGDFWLTLSVSLYGYIVS